MRHKNKFTLLELLIACAVTAIITAVAGAVIYTFPRSYEEMEMQTSFSVSIPLPCEDAAR